MIPVFFKKTRVLSPARIFFLAAFLLMINDVNGGKITGNTNLKVSNGTSFIDYGLVTLLDGGDIDNQGTIIIKGNLDNQNATLTNLGSGTFEFSGSTAQTISGLNEFGTLKIANTGGGVTIAADDQKVSTSLNLVSGLLTLGDNNLLLGPAASVSGGSASAMVIATGNGEFRKEYNESPSFPLDFTYPVGDEEGTAEYSPVTVHFTSGTFASGNYLGVKLQNQRDPALGTSHYINRYWEFANNAITDFSCNLTFNFLDADVVGNIGDLYCLKTLPSLTKYNQYSSGYQLTATVGSFSRFTGSNIIDLTSTITVEPNIMYGVTDFDVFINLTELIPNSPTYGQVTVFIPKDSRWDLDGEFDPNLTIIGLNHPVNNSDWEYSENDTYHIFTSDEIISAEGTSAFGFHAVWSAGYIQGVYTITAQIVSGSGGEYRLDNNADAENLDYFIN